MPLAACHFFVEFLWKNMRENSVFVLYIIYKTRRILHGTGLPLCGGSCYNKGDSRTCVPAAALGRVWLPRGKKRKDETETMRRLRRAAFGDRPVLHRLRRRPSGKEAVPQKVGLAFGRHHLRRAGAGRPGNFQKHRSSCRPAGAAVGGVRQLGAAAARRKDRRRRRAGQRLCGPCHRRPAAAFAGCHRRGQRGICRQHPGTGGPRDPRRPVCRRLPHPDSLLSGFCL